MGELDGGLWKHVRRGLSGWDLQRIESSLTGGGIPDANACCNGVDVWMELKWTSGWKPRIRPEQIGWSERRIRHGGRVFMLTWRRTDGGPRSPAASELWVHRGTDMRHVADNGLRGAPSPVLLQRGGPESWDWLALKRVLLTETC